MSTVFAAHAVSVDGFISGPEPGPGRGLGDATMLLGGGRPFFAAMSARTDLELVDVVAASGGRTRTTGR